MSRCKYLPNKWVSEYIVDSVLYWVNYYTAFSKISKSERFPIRKTTATFITILWLTDLTAACSTRNSFCEKWLKVTGMSMHEHCKKMYLSAINVDDAVSIFYGSSVPKFMWSEPSTAIERSQRIRYTLISENELQEQKTRTGCVMSSLACCLIHHMASRSHSIPFQKHVPAPVLCWRHVKIELKCDAALVLCFGLFLLFLFTKAQEWSINTVEIYWNNKTTFLVR